MEEEILLDEETQALADDTPLLDGTLDSLGLLRLVSFVEEEFGVDIDDADIIADNFRTVGHVARLVATSAAG